MVHVEITELTIPESVDGPGAAPFVEMTSVRNEIERAGLGTLELAATPAELLVVYRNPYESRRMLVARVGGRIVGRAVYEVQSGDTVRSAWLDTGVLPEYRRRGIGSALYERVAAFAAEDGRTVLQAEVQHPTAEGTVIESPTGFGAVPANHDAARFLLSRGYRLAQVERMSRLPLPARLPPMPVVAGYALETWEGATPPHRLADMAVLHARMSTDVPLGETDYEAEAWDEERVRDHDARNATDGRRWLVAAVRHEASDTLVGFTDLSVPPEPHRPVMQGDTIVLHEHRGHGLGMLVKLANLRRLQETSARPSVYTWNAEENRHMLDVNERLGFAPLGYAGLWRRDS